MATSSFYTTVTIKGQKNIKRFVDALEEAERSSREHKEKKIIIKTLSNEELVKIIPKINV